ncbi:MAG TPA: RidA family protein [Myxococcota bacterium]|nr:RidA family protein [Myxococcota bacterium]
MSGTKILRPADVAAPVGQYSHGIEVPAGARTVHVAGQVGIDPGGAVAKGFRAQAEQTWRNVLAVLGAAGLEARDIVMLRTYLVDVADYAEFKEVRAAFLGSHAPASTLVVVRALVLPELRIEIDCVAARS